MINITPQRYTLAGWEDFQMPTDWSLITNKPDTYTPVAHDTRVDELTNLDLSTVGRVDFDGDVGETWIYLGAYDLPLTIVFRYDIPIANYDNVSDLQFMSNILGVSNNLGLDPSGFIIENSNSKLYTRVDKTSMTGWDDGWTDGQKVAAFKTWLQANNLVVYYKLSGVVPSFTFADLKTWLNYKDATAALAYVFDSGDGELARKTLPKVKAEVVTSAAVVAGLGFTPEPAISKGTALQYFKGDMSLATMPTSLPASDVSTWAKAASKPTYNQDEVNDGSTYFRVTQGEKTNLATAYNHSQAAHAPSNAQKNSDITQAEIEAKLVGSITTHGHAASSYLLDGASQNRIRFGAGLPEYWAEGLGEAFAIYHAGNLVAGTGAANFCAGNDSRLSDARVASDVSAWAKAASKPLPYSSIKNFTAGTTSNGTTAVALATTHTFATGDVIGLCLRSSSGADGADSIVWIKLGATAAANFGSGFFPSTSAGTGMTYYHFEVYYSGSTLYLDDAYICSVTTGPTFDNTTTTGIYVYDVLLLA